MHLSIIHKRFSKCIYLNEHKPVHCETEHGNLASCRTSNSVKMYETGFIDDDDDNDIKLIIVYFKHKFISTITEVLPVLFMYV